MGQKLRKTLSVKEDTVNRLEELSDSKSLYESEIVDLAIEHYYEYEKGKTNLNEFADKTMLMLNRLDKDMKMMFQFWNHYFYAENYGELATTSVKHMKPLKQAEELVESEIRKARQRKLDRKASD